MIKYQKYLNWVLFALAIGFVGGIIGLVVSPFVAEAANPTLNGAILLLIFVVLAAFLSAHSKLAKFNFVNWVLFVATVAFWGTVFTVFVPQVGKIILSAGAQLTWVSFLFTVVYALVAERVVSYVYKPKL